jgi:RNA 3'-terminal phosphate cyclase (ATP)
MTLLPAACFASESVEFRISGGIFQDFAPSAYHLQNALFPILMKMGIRARLEIIRPGYVPRGGGVMEVTLEAAREKLKPINLVKQGDVIKIKGVALSSHLRERRVSERMAEKCNKVLESNGYHAEIEAVHDDLAIQRGAALAIWAQTNSGGIIGADRAGEPRRSAEDIGNYVASNLIEDLATGATVDRYLADQLILYAALAGGVSQYRIPVSTEHVETNLWLASNILGAKVDIDQNLVTVQGIGYHSA